MDMPARDDMEALLGKDIAEIWKRLAESIMTENGCGSRLTRSWKLRIY